MTTTPTTEVDPTGIDAALKQALAESKTPAGIARMLESLATSSARIGPSAILRGCAAQVRDLLPADDAHAALGRLAVEAFKTDPLWWSDHYPMSVVAAVCDITGAEEPTG